MLLGMLAADALASHERRRVAVGVQVVVAHMAALVLVQGLVQGLAEAVRCFAAWRRWQSRRLHPRLDS